MRILNRLEVQGIKGSRIRKTSNDTIDAESIAKYLMLTETKESYEFPKELQNLNELITAYDIINCKIRTTKNNIVKVMDMMFYQFNIIDVDDDIAKMLELFKHQRNSLQQIRKNFPSMSHLRKQSR